MKTRTLCTIVFFFTMFATIPTNAKVIVSKTPTSTAYTSFIFLRGHKAGKGFSLQWSMASNLGFQNFQVESTYEDPNDPYSNWTVKGFVTNNGLKIFKFTDISPLPGIINYRVIAILPGNAGNIVSNIFTTTLN